MPNIIIHNKEACDGCGACTTTCPQLVYTQAEKKARPEIVHPERCFGCLACEEDCPRNALRVHRLPDGMKPEDIPAPGRGLDESQVYDLIVIGAGPAGLGAAIRGRMLGLKVGVIERLPSRRRSHHPDGGILFSTKDVYELRRLDSGFRLDTLDIDFPGDIVQEWLQDFAFVGPSGQRTTPRKTSWEGFPVVDKCAFVACLAAKAENLGASIAYNTRAFDISEPLENGLRRVSIDNGKTVTARVIVSAEGITGQLVHKAGVPVNDRKLGWSIAPYADLPPLDKPTLEAAFLVGYGPGRSSGDLVPYLSYLSSGPHATHLAAGPLQRSKQRLPDIPSTDIVKHLMLEDERLKDMLGAALSPEQATFDGSRVLLRRIPQTFVSSGLIAVGDAITTCGMITNLLAIKTGDLAAQAAHEALEKNDASVETLRLYDRKVLKIKMFQGLAWMNNILIQAPMELEPERVDMLCDKLKPLQLGRVQAGEILPLLAFYLRVLPTILFNGQIRRYLLP